VIAKQEVKLSEFGYVQAWWHHDYSTSKGGHASSSTRSRHNRNGNCLQEWPSAAALAALTTPPATPSSYVQPLMPTVGGLLQSTYGEFELWMGTGGRPLYDWTGLNSKWVMK
jgi:hypothetical protein